MVKTFFKAILKYLISFQKREGLKPPPAPPLPRPLLNRDLDMIHEWLKANKLSLNVAKTKYMLIGTRQKVLSMQFNLDISLDSKQIERKRLFKSLGVNLNEILSWESHVKSISKKIAKVLGALHRFRSYVTQDTLITIYKIYNV